MSSDWNNKVKMHEKYSTDKADYFSYILKNIDSFDLQAYSIFFDTIRLIPDEIELYSPFYVGILDKIKNIDTKAFGLRTSFRIEIISKILKYEYANIGDSSEHV